ncbi:PREDICTED: uncharacterized protein LOC108758212 isoform X2 [Trachymyrmex cornetzi]|uniref:uncharacterized protein LOC108758212 isoform X2 n=1 Tax=Trachymyrmex cornetzi TaxID=471704 RepID=UPI00084EE0C5|nr:PREDICTED: uncharacterized protein LOC108758212 isoform X2 [Trachymyrmex cornetzi]
MCILSILIHLADKNKFINHLRDLSIPMDHQSSRVQTIHKDYLERMKEHRTKMNGQILRGFPSRKAVLTFSFGYSISRTTLSVVTVGMLIYSILMKQPQLSLPFIGFFLAELVCDFCDVIIMIWYFFEHLQIQTALVYTAGLLLLLLAEVWTWLDIVWLYEHRNFKIC